MKKTMLAMAVVGVLGGACTSAATTGSGGNGSGGGGGGSEAKSAFTALITADWQVEPFSEKTSEVHVMVLDRDVFVGAIRPLAPEGTHHTILSVSHLGEKTTIYGSGVGSDVLEFPPGVGLKLAAGTSLVLDLHLFNPSMATLTGTSGVEIVEVAPEDVVEEASAYMPGPLELTIPPNQESTTTSTCVVGTPFTVFAMFPHMHQLGTHLRTTVTRGDVTTVLHDEPFSFDQQLVHPTEPIEVAPGDRITTECTFTNTTSAAVHWGTGSKDEMCLSVLFRYPAAVGSPFCTK